MNLDFKLKNYFFDRRAVIDAVGKANVRVLSKIGAFMRTRARSILTRRKRSATPGETPSVHSTDSVATLKNIQFGYDPQTKSVVIGSILLPWKKRTHPVPGVTEFGGIVTRFGKTYRYATHPYMGPTLDKEVAAGTLPPHWANSVKGN